MIYEYKCNTCNLVSSVERSVYDDENIPLCCGDLAVRVTYNRCDYVFSTIIADGVVVTACFSCELESTRFSLLLLLESGEGLLIDWAPNRRAD